MWRYSSLLHPTNGMSSRISSTRQRACGSPTKWPGSSGEGEMRQRVTAELGSMARSRCAALCQRRMTNAVTPLCSAASCRRRELVSGNRVTSPTTAARAEWRRPSSIAGRTSRSLRVSQ